MQEDRIGEGESSQEDTLLIAPRRPDVLKHPLSIFSRLPDCGKASPLAAQLSAAVWISPAVEGASLQPAPIVPKNSTAAVAATAAAAVAKSPGPEVGNRSRWGEGLS